MNDKSPIGMLTEHCPICCNKSEETILMDTRLKDTLPREQHTFGKPCTECQDKIDQGYVALIGCEEPFDKDRVQLHEANRTADIVFVRESVLEKMTNVPIPEYKFVFVAPEVITMFKDAMPSQG